jgi:hypothetical protein
MIEDFEIQAIEAAYADCTIDELIEHRNHSARFFKASETTAVLQRMLEERVAADNDAVPKQWPEEPVRSPAVSAERKRQQEERRLRLLSNDGRVIPFQTPEAQYKTQRDYDLAQGYGLPARSSHSCPDCFEGHPAPTCTGHCVSLHRFFERRVQTNDEFIASEEKRKSKD